MAALDGGALGAPNPVEFTRTRKDVDRFKQGDRRAFDDLWSRYTPALELIVTTRVRARLEQDLRARLDTNDILQDAAIKVHEKLHEFTYRGPGSVLAWMTEILLHVASDKIDYWRAAIRDPRRESTSRGGNDTSGALAAQVRDPARGPLTQAGMTDLRRRVGEALSQLSERHQTIVIWKFFGGASWLEIAETLGAPSGDAVRMEFNGKILPLLGTLIPRPA